MIEWGITTGTLRFKITFPYNTCEQLLLSLARFSKTLGYHWAKMKFSIKNFFSKCDQMRRKLRNWSHLLRKPLIESFIFCAVCFLAREDSSRFAQKVMKWRERNTCFSPENEIMVVRCCWTFQHLILYTKQETWIWNGWSRRFYCHSCKTTRLSC